MEQPFFCILFEQLFDRRTPHLLLEFSPRSYRYDVNVACTQIPPLVFSVPTASEEFSEHVNGMCGLPPPLAPWQGDQARWVEFCYHLLTFLTAEKYVPIAGLEAAVN